MVVFEGACPIVSPMPSLGIKNKHHTLRKIIMGAYGIDLNGSMATFGGAAMKPRSYKRICNVPLVCSALKPISAMSSSIKSQFGAPLESDQFTYKDICTIPSLPHRRSLSIVIPNASTGISYNSSMSEKPRWWWRTLSSIPYLMPIHVMSIVADNATQFLPFLENFQLLTDPVFGMQLPSWFAMAYCLGVYFMIVRRKEWPAFFRFHVVMAMLLDNSVQIIGIVASWMPYWRKLDAPFWTVVACGFLCTILECMRSALRGEYPDIPLFSESAHIHCSM